MLSKQLLIFVLLGLILRDSYTFPQNPESSSEEDDTQQQQQQNINAESLEEFTKQIKTKGKVEKLKEEPAESDPCLEPKRIGPCKASFPRIFFNKAEGKCQTFIFGGCGANNNNFRELAECETTCAKHLKVASILPHHSEDGNEFCSLPPVTGNVNCLAYMPKWTYNGTEGQCIEYIYGGCGGSKNLFANKYICESTCGSSDKELNPAPGTTMSGSGMRGQPGKEICNLPMDKGFCYALKYRYHFNKVNNRCEKFEYGGCGGNENRFESGEECVRICGGDAPAEDLECSNAECPWELYSHYKTLVCKPLYDGQACCPTRFECPDKPQVNNTIEEGRSLPLEPQAPAEPKCQYQGKSYKTGENIPEASDTGSCRAGCYCSEGPTGKAKIMCASIECPEHLGALPRDKVGCLPLYKRGSCCAYDFYCPNDTLRVIEPGEQTPEVERFKCNLDGESYYEGQRFYPKKTKCLKCICKQGFNGTLSEEFCENIDCGIEIYYSDELARGCVPVYFQFADGSGSCCPISWECPDENEIAIPNVVEPSQPSPPVTSEIGPIPITPATEPPLIVPTPSTVEVFIPPTPPNKNRSSNMLTHEACELPKAVGSCKGHRQRYFYNKDNNTCEEFVYSGCGANDNNFVSIRDCQRLCVTSITTTTLGPDDNRALLRSLDVNQQPQQGRVIYVTEEDPCTMPKKQGNCKGYFHRYYFSPEDNSCQPFIFGGCRGNRNNFYSKGSCEATCTSISVHNLRTSVPARGADSRGDASMVKFGEDVPSTKSVTADVDPCSLPKQTGRCKAYVTSYYYDSAEKLCKTFVYGGCRGNANNFKTIQECQSRCGGNRLPSGVSRTGGQDQTSENTNNPVIQSNDSMTRPRSPSFGYLERCRLPMKAGSCLAIHPSYYYDVETNTCNFFLYSGCFGNANRFSSLNECENQCKMPPAPNSTSQDEGIGGRMSINSLPWRRPGVPDSGDVSSGTETSESGTEPINAIRRCRGPNPLAQRDDCNLPPVQGPCSAHVLRYHWNSVTSECIPFVYSGCSGNKNNFVSESDCFSICGSQPTIEQLTSEGILSCSFGNQTLPLGAMIGKGLRSRISGEVPCGVPICQCVTPPSVTCVQTSCPTPPPPTTTEKVCPIPSCGSNCKEAIGLDGCPTCDCDETESQVQVQEVFIKSVKG